jgi:hypothetical protein
MRAIQREKKKSEKEKIVSDTPRAVFLEETTFSDTDSQHSFDVLRRCFVVAIGRSAK